MSRRRWTPTLFIALLACGCGARGLPMAPLRPVAPALTDVRVDQRGVEAVVRFLIPPPTVFIEGVEVPIDAVELLVLAERYPAMTPDLLAVALDDERMTRLRNARVAAAGVRDIRQQERIAEELRVATERALEAGEPPPTVESIASGQEETEAAAGEQALPLSEDELLLRHVPKDYLRSWRDANLRPATLLESARRLDGAVDLLWNQLRMPTAIVDRREPPALPDPQRVMRAAGQISRTLDYEGNLSADEFMASASVVESIPYEDLRADNAGTHATLVFTVGIPSPGPVRTRYYLAVRALAGGKYDGAIEQVLALAPATVPVPPARVTATVVPAGVALDWAPPAGDLWGDPLTPDLLEYDVYRRVLGEPSPPTPLNPAPVATTEFVDSTPTWAQRYVYEVRPLLAPVRPQAGLGSVPTESTADMSGPRREGSGTESGPVYVFDTFPPPPISDLQASRAANRITLRWQGPSPESVAGYRVYRHEAPAPRVPLDGPILPPTNLGQMLQELAEDVADQDVARLQDLLATPEPTTAEPDEVLEPAPLCPPLPPAPAAVVPGTASPVLGAATLPPPTPRPRRRTGAMVRAGWQIVTSTLITDMRYLDPTATPDKSWVYLVEAVDDTGNAGALACVGMPREPQQ